MPKSLYFDNSPQLTTSEQVLYEDIFDEMIRLNGIDCIYLVRESINGSSTDLIFGEDPQARFELSYTLAGYLASSDQFSKGADFFSKFGLQINESTDLVISNREFLKYVPESVAIRPREGDLIYLPMMRRLFEIQFVEDEDDFFFLGKKTPYYYKISLEQYVYSSEDLHTGIDEIDEIEADSSYNINLVLNNGSGNFTDKELVYQGANVNVATASARVGTWFAGNTTLRVYNTKGTFALNSNIIGNLSGTTYNLSAYNDLVDTSKYEDSENLWFDANANTYLIKTEVDPFNFGSNE